jgi:hypothetical protein
MTVRTYERSASAQKEQLRRAWTARPKLLNRTNLCLCYKGSIVLRGGSCKPAMEQRR